MSQNQEKEVVNVFSKKFTGGPFGLGDPEDRTLRHVEEHVFITQLIKDRAHHEKCHGLIKKWGECMEENNFGLKGFLSFLTCKPPLNDMNNCLAKYYKDKEFREECEKIYLDRRSKYRATGVMEKLPYEKKPYYDSVKKREFLEKYRAQKRVEAEAKQTSDSS